MYQRLLYVLSFQCSKFYEVDQKGTLTFVLQMRMLRCTEVKKLAPRDRAGNELTRRPTHISSPHPQMLLTPFPCCSFSKRSLTSSSANKKLSKNQCVQWAKIWYWNTQDSDPLSHSSIFLRSNLVCLSSDLIPNNLRMTVLFHNIRVYNFSFGKFFSMVRYKPRL